MQLIQQPENKSALESAAGWCAVVVVLGLTIRLFSAPLHGSPPLLAYAQDDFYYYLVAARNLANGLGTTFDGATLTNGYHPLYLLLLTAVSHFAHSLRSVFLALRVLDVISAMSVFFCTRTLLRRAGAGVWLGSGLAAGLTWLCAMTISQQMEVTLTMPLALAFLLALDRKPEAMTPARFLLAGVLAAVTVLSRLDSGLLIALCGLVALLDSSYRNSLSRAKVTAFLGGSVPLLAIYFLIEEHYLHRLMPISGAAKQLRTTHGFALEVLPRSISAPVTGMFALAFLLLCCLPWWWRRMPSQERVLATAALLFPFLHWGLLLWVSDWMLWGWYGYSLRIAMAAVLLIGVRVTAGKLAAFAWTGPLAYATGLLLLATLRYRTSQEMVDVALVAEQVQAFAATHPGRYAMGDRGGMVGYLDGQPTLQTEGLMEDNAFLDHIRRAEPLRQVLKSYGVDYYIATDRLPEAPCFKAREPANAGTASPAMQDTFCDTPVAVIRLGGSGRTLIYRLK